MSLQNTKNKKSLKIANVKGSSLMSQFIYGILFYSLVISYYPQITYSKIIGTNSMRSVFADNTNIPFKYKRVLEAVGLISMGCTGTHIGNGLVLTAGHCFDATAIRQKKQNCDGVQVFWGVRVGKAPTSVSNCKQVLVLQQSDKKDYALLKVDNPPRAYLPVRLQGRVQVGQRITIFSHPFKNPLMWSGVCEVKRSVNAQIPMQMIQHQCDTNPGSSGATILDAETLEIVGIHDGGWISETGNGVGYNYGTHIDSTLIPAVLARLGYFNSAANSVRR